MYISIPFWKTLWIIHTDADKVGTKILSMKNFCKTEAKFNRSGISLCISKQQVWVSYILLSEIELIIINKLIIKLN